MGTQGGDGGTPLGVCARMLCGAAWRSAWSICSGARPGAWGLFLALSVLPVSGTLAQSSFGVWAPVALAQSAQRSWYLLVQP